MTVLQTLYIGIPRRDEFLIELTDGTKVPVVVCRLARDGTLFEIFEGFGLPFDRVSFTPEQCRVFREGYRGFFDEDHATLLLRNRGKIGHDVVRFELDDRGVLDEMSFSLRNDFVWRAADIHQVVIPTSALSRLGVAA